MHIFLKNMQSVLRSPAYWHAISQEFRLVDRTLRPTREQYKQKKAVISTIGPLLETVTGGILHMFGSCENGFWINGSDIDACLVVKGCASRGSCYSKLRLVSEKLKEMKFGNVTVISAKVPIVKVLAYESKQVICDISINNTAGLENSLLAATLSRVDPRVQPLGRFIKHWASCRKMNDRSQGTMSTYALILQLFYFLQATEPPILPLYKELERPSPEPDEDGSVDYMSGELRTPPFITDIGRIQSKIMSRHSPNSQSIGELIVGFFQVFGDHRFRGKELGQTVEVYDGTIRENNLGALALICPLTRKNVNRFSATVWEQLFQEFARAKMMLENQKSLQEICEPREISPLRKMKQQNRERMRKVHRLAIAANFLGDNDAEKTLLQNYESEWPSLEEAFEKKAKGGNCTNSNSCSSSSSRFRRREGPQTRQKYDINTRSAITSTSTSTSTTTPLTSVSPLVAAGRNTGANNCQLAL